MSLGTGFLFWLLLLSSSSLCFGSELDIQFLKSVKRSLIDPNGILTSSWNFSQDGPTNFICNFIGVVCWNPEESRILALSLGSLGLQGRFPRGLENCTSMENLDLSNNTFSGPIPSDISRQLPYLKSLNLSYNSFSGEIPVTISEMTYLHAIDLQHNNLNGPVPWQFSLFVRLTQFSVAGNLLSGPILITISKFPSSSFAGNQGLCGAPLDSCSIIRDGSNTGIIGAAVGFVLGFVVAFYFPHWLVFCGKLRPYIYRI